MLATLTGWVLGLVLGMRHALEPDHLTAVSTMMSEGRGVRRGALLGAFWGLGHTLSLLAVGLVLAALHARMPARLADAFELGVAAMLIALGARNLRRAFVRQGGTPTVHAHRGHTHAHGGPAGHLHLAGHTLARRSLLVGLVHGLAGSGALTALVIASLPTAGARLLYILLFGLGSAVGMALLSAVAGWPLARIGRSSRAQRTIAALTGALSSVLGVAWGWPLALRILG